MNFLEKHKEQLHVSELHWIPRELLKASEPYLDFARSIIKTYLPNLPEVPQRNQSQSSEQLTLNSDTDLETETSPGDVFTREETREGGKPRHVSKRLRSYDRRDRYTPLHLESTNHHSELNIPPASVDITNPTVDTHITTQLSAASHVPMSDSTRKRPRTRDGGKFFGFFTLVFHKMANAVIEDNQPQWNGNSWVDGVLNRPQPEQHNISDCPSTLPEEQARDSAPASAALITSSRDADNYDSHALQPSGQDGPENSYPPSLLSPPSPEAIDICSATGLMGGSGEESTLAASKNVGSTRTRQREGTSTSQGTAPGANSICNLQLPIDHLPSPINRPTSPPTLDLALELHGQSTLLSEYLRTEDVNDTWPDFMSEWYRM